jgi:hypothetical protein
MSDSSKEKTRDDPAVLNRMMFLVEKYQLLEKGVITQKELDHLLDSPLWEPEDEAAQMTHFKIVQANDPTAQLDEIE